MLKDLLVHLDGTMTDTVRLAHGEAVAAAFGAHLTGLFVNPLPSIATTGDGFGAVDFVLELQNQATARGKEIANALAPMVAKVSTPNEFRHIDSLPGLAGQVIASEARMYDLTVLLRPYGHEGEDEAHIAEGVLFDSGRGALFVPPGGTPPNNWNTIVVAWNGSRESARAITEAMPFLEAAEKVIVVLVDDRHPAEEKGREPGADVARHLSRHSVNAELRHVVEWDHIHAAILNEAEKSGAGLLVMGGYGHSRLREWVIGGATRGVLTEAGLPVLMAH